ncbi:MAG: HD domain-containing protein [Actinomycetota bacterium]
MNFAFLRYPLHLARRLSESVAVRELSETEMMWARTQLRDSEFSLWNSMSLVDRVHSHGVARRLVLRYPEVEHHEIAAAFLHDVGKTRSSLNLGERVLATIVGPRTKRFKDYHDHEHIGAQICRESGIDPRVCDLIVGLGPADAVARLKSADDI